MSAKSIVAMALLAGFTAAQTNTTVNIGALSLTTKGQWCSAQQVSCPELCGGSSSTSNNTCDSTTLNYTCTCTNGSSPDLLAYINTVPTFLCVEEHTECIANNAGSKQDQDQCDATENATCGLMMNPASYVPTTSTATSQAASATGASASTTGGASASASATSKAAAPTMAIGREIGTGIFAIGAAAAFGLLV